MSPPLGKRSRPPSLARTPSTGALGSLCDIPSVVGHDSDPVAPGLQQRAAAAPAGPSAGRARKQRQSRSQAQAHQRSAGSAAESGGLCYWPQAFAAGQAVLAHGGFGGPQGFAAAAVAALEPAQFLGACGLCNRVLGAGKDTYMYRGEMAFCSTACRDLHIALDNRGSTCSFASGVPQATAAATTTAAAGSKATRTAA